MTDSSGAKPYTHMQMFSVSRHAQAAAAGMRGQLTYMLESKEQSPSAAWCATY